MRNMMRNFMLGTALIAGLLGTGAADANAQEFRGPAPRGYDHGYARSYDRGFLRDYDRGYYRPVVREGFGVGVVGGPVVGAYIPPCPGDGYVWLGGAWVFRGHPVVARGYGYGRDVRFDRGYGRGFDRGRGYDRGFAGRR